MIGVYMPDVLTRTMVTDKCWLWLGSRSTKGYGQIERNGRHLQVHRIAFESEYGDLPSGLVVDHLCHDPELCVGGTCIHRTCVNPAHLAAVTNAENLARQTPAAKTHCVHGHELAGENLGRDKAGHRFCINCSRRHTKAWQRKVFTVQPSEVRRWCRAQGFPVAIRGALPRLAVAAYNAAHPAEPFREVIPLARAG
jgi:hypothetical protein